MPKKKEETLEKRVIRWRGDYEAFAAERLYIVDKKGETIRFVFNRFQKRLWSIIKGQIDAGDPSRIYLLKARQLGSSTFVQGLEFWRTVLWKNSNALVVAHDIDSATQLFEKSQVFFGKLPPKERPARKHSNRRELRFAKDDETGEDIGLQSRLAVATAKNVHLGAGTTLNAVHLSEFARYESVQQNVQLSLATLLQTVPKRAETFVILETTAWGLNFSATLWRAENDWTKIFISWLADDEYTSKEPLKESDLETAQDSKYGHEREVRRIICKELALWYPELSDAENAKESLCRLRWRREKIDLDFTGRVDLFQQEYPSTAEEAFLTSGSNVFDTRKLADYRKEIEESCIEPELFRYNVGNDEFNLAVYGDLKVYKCSEERGRYVIGADVSEGLGEDADYSVATVLQVPSFEQVAVYRGHIDPSRFADLLFRLGKDYNTASICVEVTGTGVATQYRLSSDLHYPFMYRRTRYDKKAKKHMKVYGWSTNRQSKGVMISDLRRAIDDDVIRFWDIRTLEELGWYVRDPTTGKMAAASTYNDDCVISLALAWQMVCTGQYSSHKEPKKEKVQFEGTFEWWAQQAEAKNVMDDFYGW